MDYSTALKEALRYHLSAFVPTLIGGTIAVAALWVGLLQPLTQLPPGAGPEAMLGGQAFEGMSFNLPLALGGVVVGYYVRRVGRTTLLVKTQTEAVLEEADLDERGAGEVADDSPGPVGAAGPDDATTATAPAGSDEDRTTDVGATDDGPGDGSDRTDVRPELGPAGSSEPATDDGATAAVDPEDPGDQRDQPATDGAGGSADGSTSAGGGSSTE